MKIKRFDDINEGIRDKMTPISGDKITKAQEKMERLTPYGMLNRIDNIENDYDDKYGELKDILPISDMKKTAKIRIKESLKELDDIFEVYPKDDDLRKLVPEINKWIKKYGGNPDNMECYGFTKMADQIWNNGIQWQHDVEVIYDSTVFKSFRQLLKNVAICETKYNNKDYQHY